MSFPALLIAGTHSGCGKTTLTLGVMAALARRGLAVQPFKCGPDFIDPSLHQMVTGRISRNLDVRMCGADFVRRSFRKNGAGCDCAVVEGVMGLFDGGEGSAAHLAKTLDLPVFLVIDVRSAAESVAAVAHGFATLDPSLRLAGVICNRVGSAKHRQMIADAIETFCEVPVLGFLPRNEAVSIPSRHLGLHMGEEHPLKGEGLEELVSLIEGHLDLERMLGIARQRPTTMESAPIAPLVEAGAPVRIGVARDAAFCFYYEDNLDLLRDAGAELIFFSPLEDAGLPTNLQGLYLGGGYPELHAATISHNQRLRTEILAFAQAGHPVYAECGGFMYLCQAITDQEGVQFPMVGLYPFSARMQPRLRSLGYRQPMVETDCLLAPRGTVLHGHEFHYSTIEEGAPPPVAYHLADGRGEGFLVNNTLAGYIHLHWGRTPQAAARFAQACRQHS
nr:cobyrinate a,c-diamide synthase [uncultured Desulfobulbus sp.]